MVAAVPFQEKSALIWSLEVFARPNFFTKPTAYFSQIPNHCFKRKDSGEWTLHFHIFFHPKEKAFCIDHQHRRPFC